MDQTLRHALTSILDGLEHPSWPGRTIPAVLDGHTPPTWCVHCDQLAGQIRASKRLGDRDGMTAYGWVAIRHVEVAHPAQSPRSEARAEAVQEARGPSRSHHDSTGGAR